MNYNIITVAFGALRKVTALPINYKYDIGQILRITGLDLPESYVVDFCNQGDSSTISMVGTADGVRIPDEFLQTGKPVKAYVVLSGADNTQTRYEITIPVNARPARTDIQPTPAEQQQIDSLIAAMNNATERAEDAADKAETAVSHYPKIEAGNWYVWNSETGAYEDTGIQAEGEDGVGIQSATLNADFTLTLTFTDGTSYTTPSIRGKPGQPGQDGVSPTITVTAITGGHRVEITDADGTKTFNVMDGQTGATPDIQIGTVTTLPAGSDATAEITGTPEQPRLNLGIPEGQKGDPGEVTQAQLDTALENKAPVITDTASGAIASFPDGADGLPLKSLVCNIEPVQDLHGYDSPWPAGGGKNKWEFGDVDVSGTYSQFILTTPLPAGEYTISANVTSTNSYVQVRFRNESGGAIDQVSLLADGTRQSATKTFTEPVYRIYLYSAQGQSGFTAQYKNIQIESGSTATAYAPYSNECPISGWTGLEGQRTGKNLLNIARETGIPSPSDVYITPRVMSTDKAYVGLRADNYYYEPYVTGYANVDGVITVTTNNNINYGVGFPVECKPNTTYTISATKTNGTFSVGCYDKNWNFITCLVGVTTDATSTFTTPSDAKYLTCVFGSAQVGTAGTISNIQLELGSTATAYEPYQGSSLSINWQDEAGTVYGSTIAINEGGSCKLTVGRAIGDLGDLNWNIDPNRPGVFYTSTYASTRKGSGYIIAEIYKNRDTGVPSPSSLTTANNTISLYPSYGGSYIYAVDLAKSGLTADDYKTAVTGIKYVYELATPITYTLPDVTMLSTVLGTNNIWVDTGDTTVDYRADTKLYLEKLTAPTEDDLIADHAIASGTFFMIGNTLFLATSQIAAGGTITPGTNATKLSLADALNQLNT